MGRSIQEWEERFGGQNEGTWWRGLTSYRSEGGSGGGEEKGVESAVGSLRQGASPDGKVGVGGVK